jgi:hypothetical protein
VEQLHQQARLDGRDMHHLLIETYDATDLANLVAYLQTVK